MTIVDDVLAELTDSDLRERLRFVLELDRLKTINRRTRISDQSRFENSAEHSWHLAVMAWALAPHASAEIDVNKVIRLLLVHDIVEIDADDVFLYDTEGRKTKAAQERAAADRLYGLLPDADQTSFRALWDEYEERETPEAQFAAAVDRLQPLLLNLVGNGRTWNEHGIDPGRVYEANRHIAEGAEELWEVARASLDRAVEDGILSGTRAAPLLAVDDLVVRPTTLEDLDVVLEIEGLPEHADLLGRWGQLRHQRVVGDDTALHLVFERDEQILGYGIFSSVDTPVVALDHFAIADKRQGTGRQVLVALLDHLFGAGARKVWLDTLGDNEVAIAFYESLGFAREGLLPQHDELNGRVIDLVLMATYRPSVEPGQA